MLKEFKTFIMRGNVIDLAVAVIIGGVFGKIVSSLVNDVLMPPIGLILGKVDFSNLYFNLSGKAYNSLAEAQAAGAPAIRYGIFLNILIDFLIVGFVIFMMVRLVNKLHKAQPAAPASTRECPYCLSMIPVKATRCGHCTSQLEAKTIN
ncbi:MAG: large conductance mechanosensitive channel protein MscL [Desulfobacteraceae bacterium]|nr:MAG: large conductance mechanosensitive channel protein MscL [Desulfobacteraceae bacterium]